MKYIQKLISAFMMLIIILSFSVFAENDTEVMSLLSELNIMVGDPDGNLRLDSYVSRAEFTKIAVASSNFRNSVGQGMSVSPFKDVTHNHWAAPYILVGVSNGLCKGFPDGNYQPDGTILYEEALTILLRVLGYSDSDFGYSWPYGQLGMAANLEITENVNKNIGDILTRKDVARLVYNCLDTKLKNSVYKLVTIFDCTILEDTTIYATNKQDTSLGSDKLTVLTGTGLMTYKFKGEFNNDFTGRKGDLVIKNGTDYITFFPSEQEVSEYTITSVTGGDLVLDSTVLDIDDNLRVIYKSQALTYKTSISQAKKGDKFYLYRNANGVIDYARIEVSNNNIDLKGLEKHIVYSQLNDMIITYCNNNQSQIDLKGDISVYIDNTPANIAALQAKIEIGDIIYVKYDKDNKVDYISYEKGSLDGPVTVDAMNMYNYNSAVIVRNGQRDSALQVNDIIYYVEDINLVLAYNNTKTGVYENAYPNKDIPSSVVISGTAYQLESSAAFNKLSSNGSFSFGDTVRILLGKDNKIADVVDMASVNSTVYGYLIETGEKSYTLSDTNTRTGFYAKLAQVNGEINTYITEKNYKDYMNSVVKLTFNNSIAKAEKVSGADISGKFNWSTKKLGSASLYSDIKIIDVNTTDWLETGNAIKIYPQRLDGITVNSSDILYSEKNNNGEITGLILKDVTGDSYSYGIVISTDKNKGVFSFNAGNGAQTISSPKAIYNVYAGQGAKLRFSAVGGVELMQGLQRIDSSISNVTESVLTAGGNTYTLSDKVAVYKKNYNYEYSIMPLSDLIGSKNYTIEAFYDKSIADGGKIRVIVAQEKTN